MIERVEDDGREDRRLRARQLHDVEDVELRERHDEHRRQDREVLRDVVGHRERRQRAAGDQQLLADLDDVDQLRRVGVEVDHVAGLLGRGRPGVHRDADVGLGERRRVVGAVAAHRDHPAALAAPGGSAPSCPRAWPRRGRRRRPASAAIALAVIALSPVIITVRMPIARISSNRSRMPSLTTSLRWMTPSTRAGWSRPARRPPAGCRRCALTRSTIAVELGGAAPAAGVPVLCTHLATAEPAPLRIDRGRGRSMPLIRVVARELDQRRRRPGPRRSRAADQGDDAAPLGRLVGQRGQQRCLGQLVAG